MRVEATFKPLYVMNTTRFTFCILLAAILWGAGCAAPKPALDPLAGWKVLLTRDSEKLNQAITDDYRDYIQKLPPEERKFVDDNNIWFYEDGTGQHAVRIEIGLNHTWWEHVLIYDKENKRIKVIKYPNGRYAS
jgi:hypothetical protein